MYHWTTALGKCNVPLDNNITPEGKCNVPLDNNVTEEGKFELLSFLFFSQCKSENHMELRIKLITLSPTFNESG